MRLSAATNEITRYNLNGKEYAVDVDGTTYVQDASGAWVQDMGMTATLKNIEAASPGAVSDAVQSSGFNWDSFMDNLSQIVGVVVQGKVQHDLLQVNLDRARLGQPPINTAAYTPGVNVGVSGDTKQLVYIVGGVAALIAVFAIMQPSGRRR